MDQIEIGHSKSTKMELFADWVRQGLGKVCDLIMGEFGVSMHKATPRIVANLEDAHPKCRAIIP